jgi:hypothetical protein
LLEVGSWEVRARGMIQLLRARGIV